MEDTAIPTDANGVFTLVSGYLAANGAVIQTSQHNPILEDIATALTQRVMASGVKPMTGPLLLASGSGIRIVENTVDAAAGHVGEFRSASLAIGSAVALTTNTPTDVVNLPLTIGDWDVWGTVANVPSSGSIISDFIGYIHTVSSVLPAAPNGGAFVEHLYNFAANAQLVVPVGTIRISLSADQSVHLGMRTTQTIAGQAGYGYIAARRAR